MPVAGRLESEPGVDGFGFEGQDGEDAFVDAPQGLTADDPVQGLQAQGVFAQRQRTLVAEPAPPCRAVATGLMVGGRYSSQRGSIANRLITSRAAAGCASRTPTRGR